MRRAVDRQVRWNKIRFSFSRPLYTAELLLNPVLFAFIAALLSLTHAALVPLAIVLARYLQLALIHRAVLADLTWKQLAATPLLDTLMLYAWLVPFFSNRITWPGYEARIGRGTELLQPAAG